MERATGQRSETPAAVLQRLRARVLAGGQLAVISLSAAEMAAASELILRGEAEIVSSACRPYLVARWG